MFVRRLKTKIAISLAILLLLAMILIDLVSMVTVRRELIRSEISKANLLMTILTDDLLRTSGEKSGTVGLKAESQILKMINGSQIESALLMRAGNDRLYLGRQSEISQDELLAYTRQAISSGAKSNHLSGNTWGMFWGQKAHVILSAPLLNDGQSIGGLSIVLSLEKVTDALRDSQQIIFIYILINLTILTYVGIYRISKLYLSPLARLAKRAEDYREEEEIIFAVRKEDKEFLDALNEGLTRLKASPNWQELVKKWDMK